MDHPWRTKIKNVVTAFNTENEDKGLSIEHQPAHPKAYDQMKATKTGAGFSTYEERTAASSNLDVLRCTLVANEAQAIVDFVASLGTKNLTRDKLELVRVQNE